MTAPDHEHTEALGASSETMLNRVVRSLREMAEHANTARGASWEHGARSATTLLDAADMLESLRLDCTLAYQRDRMRRVEAVCERCLRWYADGYMHAAAGAVTDEVRAAMRGESGT